MIGERIKQLRIEKGATQKDLSDYLGLTPKMVSFYENGKRFPTQANISKIAKYFNVTTDYLLGVSSVKTISEIEELERLKIQLTNELQGFSKKEMEIECDLNRLFQSLGAAKRQVDNYEDRIQTVEKDLDTIRQTEKVLTEKLSDIEEKLFFEKRVNITSKTDLLRKNMPNLLEIVKKEMFGDNKVTLQDMDGNIVNNGEPVNIIDFIKDKDFSVQLKALSSFICDIEFDEENNTMTICYYL